MFEIPYEKKTMKIILIQFSSGEISFIFNFAQTIIVLSVCQEQFHI